MNDTPVIESALVYLLGRHLLRHPTYDRDGRALYFCGRRGPRPTELGWPLCPDCTVEATRMKRGSK